MMPGGGRGGMNPRQMNQMMKKMGITTEEVDAVEVIIRTRDSEIYIKDPSVTMMKVQGNTTFQIEGKSTTRPITKDGDASVSEGPTIPAEDISLVAAQAGVSDDEAKQALIETGGDLAEAIVKLQEAKGL